MIPREDPVTFLYILTMAALLFFAHKATRVKGLLNAALWLSGTSAMTSVLIYMMGSPGIAVVELSVGAGLVTVLFVFSISIIGDEKIASKIFIPKWLAISITVVAFGILAVLQVSEHIPELKAVQADLIADTIWVDRKLDIDIQAALLISGIFGILMIVAPTAARWVKEKRND